MDVYTETQYGLSTPTGTVPVPAERVSAGFFRTLGIAPVLDAIFSPARMRLARHRL